MDQLTAIIIGFSSIFDGLGFLYLITGAALGFIFGCLPGLGGVSALALLIPFSWGMLPQDAMLLFSGAMGAVPFGGSISAILLNVPGTPQNVATSFDGYPLAQQGKSGLAIGTAAAASALGAVFGILVLVLMIPILRSIILRFGPPEFLMLILFGLVAIPLFTGRNFLTGLIAGGLGLTLSFIGFSGTSGVLRYNFGTLYLYDGIQLTPVIMGLFAVAQAFELTFKGDCVAEGCQISQHKFSDALDGIKMVFKHKGTFIRSSLVGTVIGIIPGLGGVISNIFAWIIAAQSSPRKENFGKGEIEGVIASEAANNAKDGGALLPTLAFGIPGSGEMAVLMGAFILHGLAPGPQFLRNNLDTAWTIIFGLLFSNLFVAVVGVALARHMSRLTTVRGDIIAPVIVCASLIGALASRNIPMDMFVTLLFGLIGYVMDRYDFSKITMILGFILGSMAEVSFAQSMMISENDVMIFVRRPISLGLLVALVLLVVFVMIVPMFKNKKMKAAAPKTGAKTGQTGPKGLKAGAFQNPGLYFAALLVIWFLVVVAIGMHYPLRAKIFPMVVGLFSLPLVGLIIAGYLSDNVAAKLGALKGSKLFDLSMADELKDHVSMDKKSGKGMVDVFKTSLWFLASGLLFNYLGYLPGIVIFLFSFLKIFAGHSWKISIWVTASCAAFAWIVFTLFLSIDPFNYLF